ncbi:MAG TPA: RDD family protein [Actinomycetes bacterium]|nr:RDD family protein [Actinomycetes bacterium]
MSPEDPGPWLPSYWRPRPAARPELPRPDPGPPPPASWWRRAAALLVDLLAYAPGLLLWRIGVEGLPGLGLPGTAAEGGGLRTASGAVQLTGVLLLVVGWVVRLCDRGWRQGATGRSVGKRAAGIRLVRAGTGEPPGGRAGLGRHLMRLGWCLTCLLLPVLGLSLLWPLWDPGRRTFEDMAFATAVVRDRRAG